MKKSLKTVFFAVCIMAATAAQAVPEKKFNLVINYERSWMTTFYLMASQNAYVFANAYIISKGNPPLFCQPNNLSLMPDNAVMIFEKELALFKTSGIEADPSWKGLQLEFLLLNGLKRTFPCP